MKEIFGALLAAIEAHQDTTLVTIIESSGSTPRKAGTRMLMSLTEHLAGTVGGGTVEYHAEQLSKKIIKAKKNQIEAFNLGPNEAADLGMICGGKVSILFQYLPYNQPQLKEISSAILQQLTQNKTCWLWNPLTLEASDSLVFYSKQTGWLATGEQQKHQPLAKKIGLVMEEGHPYFAEKMTQAGKVYVFGGGHVAQALVPVLTALDFYCVIADDRSEFLTATNFPTANERILVDLENISTKIKISEKDYVIIMTRGHLFDTDLQKQTLSSHPYYLGVMGSQHKVAVQKEKLAAAGFSTAEIERIKMPIGLAIQAQTPAELAISVAGELISARAARE